MIRHILALAPCFVVLAGCQSLDDGAKEVFASDFTCPKERVEVRPRAELSGYELIWGRPTPADEIRKDPERLAIWTKDQNDRREQNSSEKVFEVRGCGHQSLYVCSKNSKLSSRTNRSSCVQQAYPDDVARW